MVTQIAEVYGISSLTNQIKRSECRKDWEIFDRIESFLSENELFANLNRKITNRASEKSSDALICRYFML